MNLSGIVVAVQPQAMGRAREAIEALGWAEVHHTEAGGRMVAVIEGETTEEEIQRLQVIKRLPEVISAEMVVHYFPDEALAASPDQEGHTGADRYLNSDDEEPPQLSYYQSLKRISNY